jgi:hypothetical protein
VGGILSDDSENHFAWNLPVIQTGDEVLIRIVETDSPDPPDRIYDPAAAD